MAVLIFRFDTIAELETFGTVTLGSSQGFWELLRSSGSTVSTDTGPGSNSAGPYVATDAGGAGLDDLEENSVVDLNITSQWSQATDRVLQLRIAVIGDFDDTNEGLRVQGRTGSGAWVDIELISGWSYSNSYVVGDALGVYSGPARACVQDGGWADVEIVIPDAYDDLRFGPIATAGNVYDHDIALWSARLANSGAPSFADDTGDEITGRVGTSIASVTVPEADGGSATYVAAGLPAGLSFDTSTRIISGIPSAVGTGTITITATNSEGSADWTADYIRFRGYLRSSLSRSWNSRLDDCRRYRCFNLYYYRSRSKYKL